MSNYWTKTEIKILKRDYGKKYAKDIDLDRTDCAIRLKAESLGLKSNLKGWNKLGQKGKLEQFEALMAEQVNLARLYQRFELTRPALAAGR